MDVERYRCVKEFYINQCDDDGCMIDNAPMVKVSPGAVYDLHRPGFNLDVWLMSSEDGWLDLDEGTFRECFERVSE